jgi:hypothetical protein
MGNPVALEAKAEERDTRGFISMIIISPADHNAAIRGSVPWQQSTAFSTCDMLSKKRYME